MIIKTSQKSQINFSVIMSKQAPITTLLFMCPQGKNVSAVSAADISSLGPLVCELDPAWISSLRPDPLNFTVQALTSCKHIPRPYRGPLSTLLTNLYG